MQTAHPRSRMRWTPGPSGIVEPPTVAELAESLLRRVGRPGVSVEVGHRSETGMPVVCVVARDLAGQPIGLLRLKMLDGTPEIIDIAVDPKHQRKGIAKQLLVAALQHGFDARDIGAVWDGPLTDEGRALRDSLVAWARAALGPASWEAQHGR